MPRMDPARTTRIEVPAVLAAYLTRYLCVARWARSFEGQDGARPIRPKAKFTVEQESFLCDVADALHNFTRKDGADLFFREAVRINAAWAPHAQHLVDPRNGWPDLYPLPESDC